MVETANYNDQGTIGTNIASRGLRGIQQSEALTIVERFTRVDADTVTYDVTIDDPGPFTAPWTVTMPLNRDSSYQLFEYACHEGNYGLENSLRAGRADEKAIGAVATSGPLPVRASDEHCTLGRGMSRVSQGP